MDVIVSRSRIPGTASTYHYRALVPLAEVALQRRPRCVVIQARIGNGRAPSTRIAAVVAPATWYERELATPLGLAARLNLVAQIGRAHVCTPVTNAQRVCRPLLEKTHTI